MLQSRQFANGKACFRDDEEARLVEEEKERASDEGEKGPRSNGRVSWFLKK